MTTILIATIKGGSGKTTISVNLAAALALSGAATALVDRDRQRSSLEWLGRRPESAVPITGINWTKAVGALPDGLDFAVIDAPAALRTKEIEELVARADRIVVPVVASAFDKGATERFLAKIDEIRAISKGRTPVAIVGNRVRNGTRATERLASYLAGTSHRAVAQLRDSQSYLDVAETGISIFERRGSRAAALVAEWEPLLDFVRGK